MKKNIKTKDNPEISESFVTTIGHKLVGRKDLSQQSQRYFNTLAWLYKELFRFSKIRTLIAIIFNVLGGTLRAGALAAFIYYARLMERGKVFSHFGITFDPRNQDIFIISIVTTGLLLIISSIVIFLGNWANTNLVLDFSSYCSRRVLAAARCRPPKNSPPSKDGFPSTILGQATGMKGIVRGIRPLIAITNPAVTLIYSFIILMYINAGLTIIMIIILLPSLLLQYLVNFHATQNQKRLDGAGSRSQRSIFNLLSSLSSAPQIHTSTKRVLQARYRDADIREVLDRYRFRVMARPYSVVISNIIIAITITIVAIQLGLQALNKEISWSIFLGYLLYSSMIFRSLGGVLGSITGYARHYPSMRSLYELLGRELAPTRYRGDLIKVKARKSNKIGNISNHDFERGNVLGCISDFPPTRYNSYAFVDAVVNRNSEDNQYLLGAVHVIPNALDKFPGGTIRELLGQTVSDSYDSQISKLFDFDIEQLPVPIDEVFDEEKWCSLTSQARAQLLLFEGVRLTADFLIIDYPIIKTSGEPFWRLLNKYLCDKFIMVHYDSIEDAGNCKEDTIIAIGADGSVSLMDPAWCAKNKDKVKQWLISHDIKQKSGKDFEEFDDDEDD
jgi:ABC-type multidrug transport system fused ATPase/permease subunit